MPFYLPLRMRVWVNFCCTRHGATARSPVDCDWHNNAAYQWAKENHRAGAIRRLEPYVPGG